MTTPAAPPLLPRRRWPAAAVLALALVGVGAWMSCGPDGAGVPTATASRQTFSVVVPTTGEIDASRATIVSSPLRGDKARIIWLVEDGTRVEAGAPLVRFDPAPFEEDVVQLDARLRELEATLEEQRQGLEWERLQGEREHKTAQFDLEAAELNLRKLEQGDGPLEMARLEGVALKARQEAGEIASYYSELEKLREGGLVNPAELAQARRKADDMERAAEVAERQLSSYRDFVLPSQMETARAGLARARMTLEQTRKAAEIRALRAEAERRRTELELAAVADQRRAAALALDNTTLRAPIPGMVVLQEDYRGGEKRKPRAGDIALQDRPLVYLPDISSAVVRTRVREGDLHLVRPGLPAVVLVDAYPGLRLAGHVEFLGVMGTSTMTASPGEKFFDATVRIDTADDRLRPGMTARVEVQAGTAADVVAIPATALFLLQGRPTVYTAASRGAFAPREVTPGLANHQWAEIRAGVAAGERVALGAPAADRLAPAP